MSACALGPGARGGDVEERLRLPQVGQSLQVAHVRRGGLRFGACRDEKRQRSTKGADKRPVAGVAGTCLLADVCWPDFGERRDSSVVGARHGGLGLTVDVQVRVRRAVQRAQPLSCGCLRLENLRARGANARPVMATQHLPAACSPTTHRLTRDLKRARASLFAPGLEVHVSGRLGLGGDLTVAWARPGALRPGPLPGAAGQVVVGRGVSELGAGPPAVPQRRTPPRGGLAQREAARLLLGVQGRVWGGQPQGVQLQGFGAATRRLHHDALDAPEDLLPLCGDAGTSAWPRQAKQRRAVHLPLCERGVSAPASLLSGDESRRLLTLWLRWL